MMNWRTKYNKFFCNSNHFFNWLTNTWDMSEIEVYHDILSNYNYPIFYGLLIGHTNPQFTLPLNTKYKIKTSDNSLIMIENALEF